MVLDAFRRWWRGDDLATRQHGAIDQWQAYPPVDAQLLAIQGMAPKPWLPLSVRDALGVPSVFRAVTLLSNLAGSLTPVCYRNGVALLDTPRVVARPDPFSTPRDFYRGTVWNMATRGEFIWLVTARDQDRNALALLNLPLGEITVDWIDRRLGRRSYTWQGVELDPRSVIHGVFAQEPGSPRGVGPLQLCGAALSVAAEADEWAASYFAGGGVPPVVLVPKVPTPPEQAKRLQSEWIERAVPGMPRVASQVDVVPLSVDAEHAQLTESRLANRGEVGVMFGIPGHLLEYSPGGSSLTYQNLGAVGDELVRFTLAPGYLEPIEQAFSDLLSRTTVTRFDVNGLLRSDPKSRAEIYRLALGPNTPWLTADEARQAEGLAPGSVEYAPVPPNAAEVRLPAGISSEP